MTPDLTPEIPRLPLGYSISAGIEGIPAALTAIVIAAMFKEFLDQNSEDPAASAMAQISYSQIHTAIDEYTNKSGQDITVDILAVIFNIMFQLNSVQFIPQTNQSRFVFAIGVFKLHTIAHVQDDVIIVYSLNNEIWRRLYKSSCPVERLTSRDFLISSYQYPGVHDA